MRTRFISFGVFVLFLACQAQAGMYMGTSVAPPLDKHPHQAVQVTKSTFYNPTTSNAQLGKGSQSTCQPYLGKGPLPAQPCVAVGKVVAVEAHKPMAVSIRSGSLKGNVEKIVRQGGWGEPIWRPGYDYNWIGNVTITGQNVQDVLAKLLEPYPLQAVFYQSNHVVAIQPRRST